MEELFDSFARAAGSIVEAVAVLTVFYGSVEAFIELLPVAARPRATHGERKAIWRRYGVWLLLGLEFEFAADIIGSVVSPTWQEVGKLGAIAVIRTFLNYFLEKISIAPRRQERAPGNESEGIVDDVTTRFFTDLIGRLSGPLSFRLILQPMMAAFFAVRDGLKEERQDRRHISGACSPHHRRNGASSFTRAGRPSSKCSRWPLASCGVPGDRLSPGPIESPVAITSAIFGHLAPRASAARSGQPVHQGLDPLEGAPFRDDDGHSRAERRHALRSNGPSWRTSAR